MALQKAEERKPPVWQVLPVVETVAGFGYARSLMALSYNGVVTGLYSSNTATGVSLGGTYFSGTNDYDPTFVAGILKADSSEPEASFDNVVDMLDWLNRE